MSISYDLVCHPSTPTSAVEGVRVTIQREKRGRIGFSYTLVGNRGIRLARRQWDPPQRRDGLWQGTCFEAFVMPGDGPDYAELNFAPNEDWAAYRFASYREGQENLDPVDILFWHEQGEGDLQVLVDLHAPGMFQMADFLRLGLSAVLKDNRGKLSYWALAHPGTKPDFHDPACFTARLAAPRGT